MKTTLKIKTEYDHKNKDNLKNDDNLKNWPLPPNYFVPPPLPLKKLPEIFLMTSDLDSHTATDVKQKQKRRHFNEKMTRANFYMYTGVGQGTCKKSRLYTARAYTS